MVKLNLPGSRPPSTATEIEEIPEDGHGAQMTILEHIDELRERLLKAALGLVVGTVIGLVLAGEALRKFGGDSVAEVVRNRDGFVAGL